MAATIARAIGRGRDWVGESSRPGPTEAEAQANTFATFTKSVIQADGSVRICVRRGDDPASRRDLLTIDIGPETDAQSTITVAFGGDWQRVHSKTCAGQQIEIWKPPELTDCTR